MSEEERVENPNTKYLAWMECVNTCEMTGSEQLLDTWQDVLDWIEENYISAGYRSFVLCRVFEIDGSGDVVHIHLKGPESNGWQRWW